MKWRVERHDCDDGSINYEIWQDEPYGRICTLNDSWDSPNAKECAELIVAAVQHEELNETLIDAIEAIKQSVVGEQYPRWHTTMNVTETRSAIADLCDNALTYAKAKSNVPTDE